MRMEEAAFLRDVRDHGIQILQDSDVYRHVRFKTPGSSAYYFDLITWPGRLCIAGDMGTYVFSRLRDMFEFFRTDRPYGPNFGYWAEKVEAQCKSGGLKKFDEDKFEAAIKEFVREWISNNRVETTRRERRDLWDEIQECVLLAEGDKVQAACEFNYPVNPWVKNFVFHDFWDVNVDDWTYSYQWCCHAIVWGIRRYDEAKGVIESSKVDEVA